MMGRLHDDIEDQAVGTPVPHDRHSKTRFDSTKPCPLWRSQQPIRTYGQRMEGDGKQAGPATPVPGRGG